MKEIKETLEAAMIIHSDKACEYRFPIEAMQQSQALLNTVQAYSILVQIELQQK